MHEPIYYSCCVCEQIYTIPYSNLESVTITKDKISPGGLCQKCELASIEEEDRLTKHKSVCFNMKI